MVPGSERWGDTIGSSIGYLTGQIIVLLVAVQAESVNASMEQNYKKSNFIIHKGH